MWGLMNSANPQPTPAAQRYNALPPNLPPLALSRDAAAQYIGVSPSKFDQLVKDGRMPKPKRIDNRRVWDRQKIELAFQQLPGESEDMEANKWSAFH